MELTSKGKMPKQNGNTVAVTITNEQLEAIGHGSQEFAELAMADKIRWYEITNAKLRTQAANAGTVKASLKVGEKGGVSRYGFGQWPQTLYGSQMVNFYAPVAVRDTLKFALENIDKLSFQNAKNNLTAADVTAKRDEVKGKLESLIAQYNAIC